MTYKLQDMKIKDIKTGAPFTVYGGYHVNGLFNVYMTEMCLSKEPMKIDLTINYIHIAYASEDERDKIEHRYLPTEFHAVFHFKNESIKALWKHKDLYNKINSHSNYGSKSMIQSHLSAKQILPSNINRTFDETDTIKKIMPYFTNMAKIMWNAFCCSDEWMTGWRGYVKNDIFGYRSPLTLFPVERLCYQMILTSNEKLGVDLMKCVIHHFDNTEITGPLRDILDLNSVMIEAFAPIVEIIHDVGKPELFRNIPMEIRLVMVSYFNLIQKHDIVAELNHYHKGDYKDPGKDMLL